MCAVEAIGGLCYDSHVGSFVIAGHLLLSVLPVARHEAFP
jgi:hypothetical protein